MSFPRRIRRVGNCEFLALGIILNVILSIQNNFDFLFSDGPWGLHKVELALWTYFVAKELKPELLDSIPCANGSSAAVNVSHQNGDMSTTDSNSPSEVRTPKYDHGTSNFDSGGTALSCLSQRLFN